MIALRHHKTIINCLCISILIHLSILLYFYTHPILLTSSWQSLFGLSSADPEWLKYDQEDKAFAEMQSNFQTAFDHLIVQSPHLQKPRDHLDLAHGIALAPQPEPLIEAPPELILEMPWETDLASSLPHVADPLLVDEIDEPELLNPEPATQIAELPFNPPFEPHDSLAFDVPPLPEEALSNDLVTLDPFTTSSQAVSLSFQEEVQFPDPITPIASLKVPSHLQLEHISTPELSIEEERIPLSSFLTHVRPQLPPLATTTLPHAHTLNIDDYALPPMATAVDWSDEFDAQIHFTALQERKGYAFTVTLQPQIDLNRYGLKQNIYFVIDRSHSVQKHRFSVFKRAVLKALTSMQSQDAFNIYIIDKKITKFSPSLTRVNKKAIDAAEAFLEQQQGGGLFAESNPYTALDKVLADLPSSEGHEVYTAILLTDGNALKSSSQQQKEINRWIDHNSGRLSLYTAAVGQNNQSLMLDMLSSVSGGKFLYSDTHASFPRKLAKLILDIKNPIAQQIMISAKPHRNNAQVEFSPALSHLPNLYGHQSYSIHGYIDAPCDFDLIVQGKHDQDWIAITKTFSFQKRDKSTALSDKQWQISQVPSHYMKFLKEGKTSHLDNARQINEL